MLLSSPKNEVILLEYRTPVGSAPCSFPQRTIWQAVSSSWDKYFQTPGSYKYRERVQSRILFQMEVTADKGTYFLIQKQLGALLLHLPFFYGKFGIEISHVQPACFR